MSFAGSADEDMSSLDLSLISAEGLPADKALNTYLVVASPPSYPAPVSIRTQVEVCRVRVCVLCACVCPCVCVCCVRACTVVTLGFGYLKFRLP